MAGGTGAAESDYEMRIATLEEETREKVSYTISKIESAVETWKAAKKPDSLRKTIVKLQNFYEELTGWERESLIKRKEKDVKARIERLRRFTEICERHEKELGRRAV